MQKLVPKGSEELWNVTEDTTEEAKQAFLQPNEPTRLDKVPDQFWSAVTRILPVLLWLPRYKRKHIVGDILGGLTVAVMVIPQGMSYAVLAELPPVYGLFCAIAGPIVYTLLGTSWHLSIGPVALICLSLPSIYESLGISEDSMTEDEIVHARTHAAVSISMVTGIVLATFGLLRLGIVTRLLPPAVMLGFTNAAALSIGISQLKELLGFKVPSYNYTWQSIRFVLTHLGDTERASAVLGLSCIAFLICAKHLSHRLKETRNSLIRPIVGSLYPFSNLVLVVGTALIARSLIRRGIELKIVKHVPGRLPPATLPSLDNFGPVLGYSITSIVLVALMETYAVARKYATQVGYPLDLNQELRALGSANIIGALFSAFPVSGSFSRTAVSFSSGTNTPLANTVSAIVVMFTLSYCASSFYYIPRATLGAIIEVALLNLWDFQGFRREYQRSICDLVVALVTFVGVLGLNTEYGLLLGLGSLLVLLYWMPRGGVLLLQLWLKVRSGGQACVVILLDLSRFAAAPPWVQRRLTDYLRHSRSEQGEDTPLLILLDARRIMHGGGLLDSKQCVDSIRGMVVPWGVASFRIFMAGAPNLYVDSGIERAPAHIEAAMGEGKPNFEILAEYGVLMTRRERQREDMESSRSESPRLVFDRSEEVA